MKIIYDPRKAQVGDVVRLPGSYWRVTADNGAGTLGAVPLRWWQVPWAVLCDMWQATIWVGEL